MKLRLRSLESKQTHRLEIPNTTNFQQLKEAIILQLFPSSSSSSSSQQHNLLLSLNKKDEIRGSSPDVSLQSLGVTSGDLIYYSINPFAFSSPIPDLPRGQLHDSRKISTNNAEIVDSVSTQKVESVKLDELSVPSVESRDLMETQMEGTSNLSNPSDHFGNSGNTQMIESSKVDGLIGSGSRTQELKVTQIEISLKLSDVNGEKSNDLAEGADEMEVDDESDKVGNHKFSVPSFLNKVFVKELGDAAAAANGGGDYKLLVIALHAVLLESGFVAYDQISGRKVDGFFLSEEWPSQAFGITLHYTLPEVTTSKVDETVVIKFQTMGKFMNIYGSLAKKGFGVRRVCLDEPRFLPALSYIWKRGGDMTDICSHNETDDSRKLFPNHDIFEFWKIVKDGLSYPLLIDLCEQVGLVPPPCLKLLPTELKLKILESLPAVDVARMECVSSELRTVASNNDLWRMKYEQEFGNAEASQRECQWKAKFSSFWKAKRGFCRLIERRQTPRFMPRHGRHPPFITIREYGRIPPVVGVPLFFMRTGERAGFEL